MRRLLPDLKAIHLFPLSSFNGLAFLVTLLTLGGTAQTQSMDSIAKEGHCSEIRGTPDDQTLGCLVWDRRPDRFSEPRQIEIYREGALPLNIEPGEPIHEWYFWEKGRQLAIYFGVEGTKGTYALYDTTTAIQVDKVPGTLEPHQLPQWAKSQSQLEDESVAEGSVYDQQRTMWIAKVMRQISTIQPGMRRKDLSKIFYYAGGLSSPQQRTYVHVECPYIKVDVRFKAADGKADTPEEDPEDIIESISRPYLEWGVSD